MDLEFVFSFFSALISLPAIDVSEITKPIVTTTHGKVEGRLEVLPPFYDIDTFYGIPYAKVPLRFEKPFFVESWNNIFVADHLKLPCPHRFSGATLGSLRDDCLYLNLMRPSLRDVKPIKYFPIVIVITGAEQSDQLTMYNHKLLMQHFVTQYVIVATITYRRGILGFMYTDEEDRRKIPNSFTNNGLNDLKHAIEFIYNNAYQFHGNQNQITLLGEGEGAFIAGLIARSPIIDNNLFHKVIQISGATPSLAFTEEPKIIRTKSKAFIQHEKKYCDSENFYPDCMQIDAVSKILKNAEDFGALSYLPSNEFPLHKPPSGLKRFLIGVDQCTNRSQGALRVLNRHRDFNRTTVLLEAIQMFKSIEIAEKVVTFYEEQSNHPKNNKFKLPAVREALDYVVAGHKVWFYEYTYPDYLGPFLLNLNSRNPARKTLNKFILSFAGDDEVSLPDVGTKVPFIPPSFDKLPYVHFEKAGAFIIPDYRPQFRKFWKDVGDEHNLSWASIRVK